MTIQRNHKVPTEINLTLFLHLPLIFVSIHRWTHGLNGNHQMPWGLNPPFSVAIWAVGSWLCSDLDFLSPRRSEPSIITIPSTMEFGFSLSLLVDRFKHKLHGIDTPHRSRSVPNRGFPNITYVRHATDFTFPFALSLILRFNHMLNGIDAPSISQMYPIFPDW
jgi:hypothetical protein